MLSGLFGANEPEGNAASELAPHCVSTDGKPPSSSRVIAARLLLLQPDPVAGFPGRSIIVTDVPPGDVSFTIRSPTHEWLIPTVVDPGSALGVPSILKLRSVIVQVVPTANGMFTPAGTLSGITTAGPVYETVVAVGAGDGLGVGVGPTVGVGDGVGVGLPNCCVTVWLASPFTPPKSMVAVRGEPVVFAATE